MLKSLLLVFIGGGLGAVLRFLIGKASLAYFGGKLPIGTFVSNLISCILLALILYAFQSKDIATEKWVKLALIIGFCGGLSTFSTFSFETFELLKNGFILQAILNVTLSICMGLGALYFIYLKFYKA